jgi:hypothetical protein
MSEELRGLGRLTELGGPDGSHWNYTKHADRIGSLYHGPSIDRLALYETHVPALLDDNARLNMIADGMRQLTK